MTITPTSPYLILRELNSNGSIRTAKRFRIVFVSASIGLFCLILLTTEAPNRFTNNITRQQRAAAGMDPKKSFTMESDKVYQRLLDLSSQKNEDPTPIGSSDWAQIIQVDDGDQILAKRDGRILDTSGAGNSPVRTPVEVIIIGQQNGAEANKPAPQTTNPPSPQPVPAPSTRPPSPLPSNPPSPVPLKPPSPEPLRIPNPVTNKPIIPVSTVSTGTPERSGRPKVYAFYVKRDWNVQEQDDTMISNWKQVWNSAGYDPQVLAIENATKHPDYETYVRDVNSILSTTSIRDAHELMPCYARYLAMNVVGGGMMVDLDMTPKTLAGTSSVTTSIPDKLTVYCNFDTPPQKEDWVKQVETQNGLPCAVVAGADEWLRVGKMMNSVAKRRMGDRVWTDAHALQYMTGTGDVKFVKEEIAQSLRPSGWDRCHFRYV